MLIFLFHLLDIHLSSQSASARIRRSAITADGLDTFSIHCSEPFFKACPGSILSSADGTPPGSELQCLHNGRNLFFWCRNWYSRLHASFAPETASHEGWAALPPFRSRKRARSREVCRHRKPLYTIGSSRSCFCLPRAASSPCPVSSVDLFVSLCSTGISALPIRHLPILLFFMYVFPSFFLGVLQLHQRRRTPERQRTRQPGKRFFRRAREKKKKKKKERWIT